MKRLFSILLFACALAVSTQAQTLADQNNPKEEYKPILESAHPEIDSIAFAKVRARMDSIRQHH
ncbi:MAG: hypothetical protein IJ654_09555 [Bacteroidales bacterium]|nr:hypothetical protein [Bacteroidales bacterium]